MSVTCKINPIYQQFFMPNLIPSSLDALQSSPQELIQSADVDFSIDERTWLQTAQTTLLFSSKIFLFPWAIYESVQYIAQRMIMMAVYPAQSTMLSILTPSIQIKAVDQAREKAGKSFASMGYIVRHVTLEKNGIRYSGLMIGHKKQIRNGKWILQAMGQSAPIDYCAKAAIYCKEYGFNLLMVNGPGVGRSQGTATLETMGDAQEIGLSFLEAAVKAKKIIAAGHSLGGIAIAEAVLKHDFKKGIDYHVISQQSLDSITNVFKESYLKWRFLSGLIGWAGCNNNNAIAAAKKLSELGIRHTIINSGKGIWQKTYTSDGVIPAKAALGYCLQKEGIVKEKVFMYSPISHKYPAIQTAEAVGMWDTPFKTYLQLLFLWPVRAALSFAL